MKITIHWKDGSSESDLIRGDSCADVRQTLACTWDHSKTYLLDFIRCEWEGRVTIYPEEIKPGKRWSRKWRTARYLETNHYKNIKAKKMALLNKVN